MPHPHLLDDSDHWRKRAKEMRALAQIATKKDVKEALLRIATKYDGLAKSARSQPYRMPQLAGSCILAKER